MQDLWPIETLSVNYVRKQVNTSLYRECWRWAVGRRQPRVPPIATRLWIRTAANSLASRTGTEAFGARRRTQSVGLLVGKRLLILVSIYTWLGLTCFAPGLSGAVDRHLNGFGIDANLWWVCAHCYGQREALACNSITFSKLLILLL